MVAVDSALEAHSISLEVARLEMEGEFEDGKIFSLKKEANSGLYFEWMKLMKLEEEYCPFLSLFLKINWPILAFLFGWAFFKNEFKGRNEYYKSYLYIK
jgi:hypothetical protein